MYKISQQLIFNSCQDVLVWTEVVDQLTLSSLQLHRWFGYKFHVFDVKNTSCCNTIYLKHVLKFLISSAGHLYFIFTVSYQKLEFFVELSSPLEDLMNVSYCEQILQQEAQNLNKSVPYHIERLPSQLF